MSTRTHQICHQGDASISDVDGVMIENVLTERFANFFRRSGWYEVKNYSHPNFYKFMYPEGRP